MKPHKHAEVIKAWADGAEIEYEDCGWHDCTTSVIWDEETKYRVKPAAPKWPQTTMPEGLLISKWYDGGPVRGADQELAAMWRAVNAGIEYECSIGALVPADKVRAIEAKARAEGKREGMNPVHVIEAAWNHMKLGRLDPETIQIILLKAAAK